MKTWQFIIDRFDSGLSVVLLYVLESLGSSPGRQGFHMAVSSDGSFFGTIGGGIMEHKFVELAKNLLQGKEQHAGVYQQVHDTFSKNRSGMICSGEQTVFVYQIQKSDIQPVRDLINSLQEKKKGTIRLTNKGISFLPDEPFTNFLFEKYDDENFLYEEKTGYKNILHVIGGGHCSLALCRVMSRMDFEIFVYDDRLGLSTMAENDFATHKFVLKSYTDIGDLIGEGDNVYLVIMTFGYRTDDQVVRSIAGKKYKYIGLLGSENKIRKMFDQYREENIDPQWLADIHSPVGIQIKSETVEEIAVSIAAEIISVKNRV